MNLTMHSQDKINVTRVDEYIFWRYTYVTIPICYVSVEAEIKFVSVAE